MNNDKSKDQLKTAFAPLVLRLVTGIGFMDHGWAKLSRGTAGFEKLLTLAGVPFPHINALLVPYIELLGGLALILGLAVTFVSAPLAVTMLGAMLSVQINYGFSSVKTIGLTPQGPLFGPPGYEINLLYLAALTAIILLSGYDRYSLDNLIFRNKT